MIFSSFTVPTCRSDSKPNKGAILKIKGELFMVET